MKGHWYLRGCYLVVIERDGLWLGRNGTFGGIYRRLFHPYLPQQQHSYLVVSVSSLTLTVKMTDK